MVTGRLSASVLHHESMDGDLCANKTVNSFFYLGVAKSGIAPALGAGGRRFESCHLDHYLGC